MRKIAVIVAGGHGSRFGGDIPKQFLPLNGKPLLIYSLEKFHSHYPDCEIVIALPEEYAGYWKKLTSEHEIQIPHTVVAGGKERFHSVRNALELVDCQNSLVAVHDAARPFVSVKLIDKLYTFAAEHGSAIPAVPVSSTLRYQEDDEWVLADRTKFRLIQTPQVFIGSVLKEAYKVDYDPSFTDDAAVYEAAGNMVHLIDGEEENIKITTPLDWDFAEFHAKNRSQRR